jgi:hypothetical protein
MSDGSTGAPLNLMALFASYDRATAVLDDRDLASAAAEARAETERQTESHWAR